MLKQIFFLISSFLLISFYFDLPAQDKVTQSESKMITYTSGDDTIKGYLSQPEGEGDFPAIIVIHEWWGLSSNL